MLSAPVMPTKRTCQLDARASVLAVFSALPPGNLHKPRRSGSEPQVFRVQTGTLHLPGVAWLHAEALQELHHFCWLHCTAATRLEPGFCQVFVGHLQP